MTLRFVKTSILSSEDGIDFGKEVSYNLKYLLAYCKRVTFCKKVAVESEEATAAKIAAERASAKPLYQQIAEIKERKQQEYDENTKKIFAPPKVGVALRFPFLVLSLWPHTTIGIRSRGRRVFSRSRRSKIQSHGGTS